MVDQVQTNYQQVKVGLWYYNQSDVTELLILRDPHYQFIRVACVLSRLQPSNFYIRSCEKWLGLRPRPFSQLRM